MEEGLSIDFILDGGLVDASRRCQCVVSATGRITITAQRGKLAGKLSALLFIRRDELAANGCLSNMSNSTCVSDADSIPEGLAGAIVGISPHGETFRLRVNAARNSLRIFSLHQPQWDVVAAEEKSFGGRVPPVNGVALISPARHLKCDVQSKVCRHCRDAGVECNRTSVRFREGLTLSQEPGIAFPGQESWPKLQGRVRFHDETPEITSLYVEAPENPAPQFCNFDYFDAEDEQTHAISATSETDAQQHRIHSPLPECSPGLIAEHSPATLSVHTATSSRSRSSYNPIHRFTEREAILLRNFVENMALWADITDPQRHFKTEVPARTLKDPVLRYAVLAFSSRHLNRQNADDATEALMYHNHCVQLLIPAMSEPEYYITEDILAAVAILRQHEEMDGSSIGKLVKKKGANLIPSIGDDNQFHLTGTTHILNTISTFGSSGGLGEAAAWLCLRQDIYISLTTQQPLRTNLQSFLDSTVFDRDDDFAWSSKMVFLLAKALQGAFCADSDFNKTDNEIQEWFDSKPHTFEPIQVAPCGPELDRRFPTIWMLLPVHVIGLQYYHMAKIVLALSKSLKTSSTYENLRQSRLIEKNMRHHLLTVLGLAKSNSKAENTLFTARHSLVAWGWVLRSRGDQEAAESLLRDMHARTGWNMETLIGSLREQWNEEYDDT
ncbi:hypothetical protein N7532_000790 [Penicillium argentinense]|uniref:Zn(2)-C6 fungal-type domain-containing protein n=1 Tax=Penicillium argentinense TaxID=1131581 RepID=A0A9W9G6W2_9EURO|nr:uncharacterized protein N7532_000790 [Penicillium argentinense]KAJ5112745.1 hypothetical protein N7532_000790 [Penicillium argentinense]